MYPKRVIVSSFFAPEKELNPIVLSSTYLNLYQKNPESWKLKVFLKAMQQNGEFHSFAKNSVEKVKHPENALRRSHEMEKMLIGYSLSRKLLSQAKCSSLGSLNHKLRKIKPQQATLKAPLMSNVICVQVNKDGQSSYKHNHQ